ncbi:MAG TPA: hypothetical protein VLI21_11945 [Casimicrobiaceae bacterium]|nr:hypothetical protein [Casimicrobiaceae bacterium]
MGSVIGARAAATSRPWAASLVRLLVAASALALAQSAAANAPPLTTVEIVDRTTGATLGVYDKDGQRYVIGVPGHEYAIRVRNHSQDRLLAVMSVDGVNVVTGESASPDQSGYVIEGGSIVEIAGWRRSLAQTSAFYFTDLGDSYAARTGRPGDVGVIGVAVFTERRKPVMERWVPDKLSAQENAKRERGDLPASAPGGFRDEARAAASSASSEAPSADAAHAGTAAKTLAPQLGTGFGRDEASYAERVRFDRASTRPAEVVAIRYDRRENLAAMGVLPSPRYAERSPEPFPAMRFVPAPR